MDLLSTVWGASSRSRAGRLVAATGLMLATWSGNAAAQTDTFYLDRAQISGAPDDGFMVWRPYMYEETRFYAHSAAGFTVNPLRASSVTDDEQVQREIDNIVQGQFILYPSVGTEITRRLGINLMLPFIAYQFTGEDPIQEGVGDGGITGTHVALMDLRLDMRLLAWESDDRKTRLGLGGAVWIPTGNQSGFASDDASSGFIYGSAEHDFGKFLLTGMLGPQFRPQNSIGGDEGDLFVGNELRYAIGAFLPLREDKVRLGAELWGTTGIQSLNGKSTFFAGNNTTIEWLAQARFLLDERDRLWANIGGGTRLSDGYGAPDVRLLANIGYFWTMEDFEPKAPHQLTVIVPDAEDYDKDTDGDGYPDSVDNCPTIKEDGKPPNPTDGCPAPKDRDNDGIPDSEDKCPDDPEDKDGIEDQDGCPEVDADNDKVPDVEDKCPTEPGPRSKIAEKNGCPSLTKVTSEGTVALLEPIQFETGRATIKPVSYPILDEVVTLMDARPELRIAVHGHTDSVGGREMNLKLSKDRAASVRKYLTSKGIKDSRLESEGFGPDKPIAPNNTAEGRAKNRRVEFKILEGADGDDGFEDE